MVNAVVKWKICSGEGYRHKKGRNVQGLLSMVNAIVKWKICSGEGYRHKWGDFGLRGDFGQAV